MKTLTALAFFAATTAASADNCISIENDLDRLACYDRAEGRSPKVERISTSPGKWIVETETSALSDRTNVVTALESNEIVNCGWNNGDKVLLIARCSENTTSVYFNTGCHMASSEYSNYGQIQYRLDDQKSQTINGDSSTDNRSLGLWRGSTAIPLIKQMLGKSQMVVKMTPYSENSFTATFDIAGMEQAIEPLRKSCGW